MPTLQLPAWAQLSPDPAATMGKSPVDARSCGQGTEHGRLVRLLNGSGVWRAMVSSFLPREGGRSQAGCPVPGLADFVVMGVFPGGAIPPGTHRGWVTCWGMWRRGQHVPTAAPALGLPFWGEGAATAAPPDHRQSCLSAAPTAAAMALLGTQRALFSLVGGGHLLSPPVAVAARRPRVVPPGALVLRLPVPEDMFPGGKGWLYPVSLLPWQRKAGGVVTAAETREIIVGVGKMRPRGGEVGNWLYLGKNVAQPLMGRQTKPQRVQRQHVVVTEVAASLPLLVMLTRVGPGAGFATWAALGQAAETWHS